MSTTFAVRTSVDGKITDIPVARRVGGKNGAEMFWINDIAHMLMDEQRVIPLDNSAQGIHTIRDIEKHIENQ